MANSKIDMQKEFDLSDIKKETPVKPIETNEEKAQRYYEYVQSKMRYNKGSIKTPFNAEFFVKDNTKFTKPSMTLPAQSMGLRELLSKYAKGLPVSVRTPEYYGEEGSGVDIRTLDLVDIQEIKHELNEKIQSIKDQSDKNKAKKEKAAKEAEDAQKLKDMQDKVNTQAKAKDANVEETKPI